MSRIDIKVGRDDDCAVGFDPGLESLFFQSGRLDARGKPVHWIGYSPRQILSLPQLEGTIRELCDAPSFSLPPAAHRALLHEASRYFDQLHQAGALSRSENKTIQRQLVARPMPLSLF